MRHTSPNVMSLVFRTGKKPPNFSRFFTPGTLRDIKATFRSRKARRAERARKCRLSR